MAPNLSDHALPQDELALEALIADFETGTLFETSWTHAAHIFTGACYVHTFGEAAAIDRMRTNVSAYNLTVGGQNTPTSGYYETVTVLWIKLLAEFHTQHPTFSQHPLCEVSGGALCPAA